MSAAFKMKTFFLIEAGTSTYYFFNTYAELFKAWQGIAGSMWRIVDGSSNQFVNSTTITNAPDNWTASGTTNSWIVGTNKVSETTFQHDRFGEDYHSGYVHGLEVGIGASLGIYVILSILAALFMLSKFRKTEPVNPFAAAHGDPTPARQAGQTAGISAPIDASVGAASENV